ncbi:MAG: hypothetical protein LBH96_03360 [Candidatus Peribacteria bacterium]|jgi:hypothetical protein|nr:hypothetical protein [Candidatus Peribacteria bacterium]
MTLDAFKTEDFPTEPSMNDAPVSPDQALKNKIEKAKEETSAKKIERINTNRKIIPPEIVGEKLNTNITALEKQAEILLRMSDPVLLNIYINKEVIPAIQNNQLKIMSHDIFECFRLTLKINTGNQNPTDEEVEKYIHALLDTSDSHHSHDRKPMSTKPTFKPAS